jgi:hypothetical protein
MDSSIFVLTTIEAIILGASPNPDPLNFADADIVASPVVKAGGLCVRMPGHSLRDFYTTAFFQVISYDCRPERVTAGRGFNFSIGRAPANHPPDITAQHRPLGERLVLPIAERKSGPLR